MLIAIDFDGVICMNGDSDRTTDVMFRQASPGTREAIEMYLAQNWTVAIYSVRASGATGIHTIEDFLTFVVGLPAFTVHNMLITDRKPKADIYIDDHAVRFNGRWMTPTELDNLADNWLGKR